MYLFLRGEAAEDDFCYIRFGNGYGTGSWYNISGVPTTYTNGAYSYVNPNMAVSPMAENTPVQLSLDGTSIDGVDVTVQVSINSVRNMSSSDSLHLFIAATLDEVGYTGYNGEPVHQDVFLGWITEGLSGEIITIEKEEITKDYTWEMPSNWPQNNFETSFEKVDTRVRSRFASVKIENISTEQNWRFDSFRADVRPDGRR